MYSMSDLSEQKIMVYCDFEEPMAGAIDHGLRMAGIFKKELCLFHPLGTDDKTERPQVQKKLETIIRQLKKQTAGTPISSLTLKGHLADTIDRITDDYDGIMLILATGHIREKTAALRQSQIPFLFVSDSIPEYLRYDRILLPFDSRKAIKNSSLWASYFCRFNQSYLSLLIAQEKNTERQKQIGKNLKFITALFSNLSLEFQLDHSEKNKFHLPTEALTKCRKEKFNLIIFVPDWQPGSEDFFPEEEIIKEAARMPVLFINPNRHMYILCD